MINVTGIAYGLLLDAPVEQSHFSITTQGLSLRQVDTSKWGVYRSKQPLTRDSG